MGYERFYDEKYAATLNEEQRQTYRGFCEKAAKAKENEEKARAARNEYRRNWAKANPDKVREQQTRYWAKRAERAAATDPATNQT